MQEEDGDDRDEGVSDRKVHRTGTVCIVDAITPEEPLSLLCGARKSSLPVEMTRFMGFEGIRGVRHR